MPNNQPTDLPKPSGTQPSEQQIIGAHADALRGRALSWASPFGLMSRMLTDMTQLMETIAALQPSQAAPTESMRPAASEAFVPPLEMLERNGQLVIRADMPGLSKDHIKIEVEDHQLLISGEREAEREERQGSLYRSERRFGSFSRIVPLPAGAQPEQATATFRDGVLEIVMPAPKRAEAKRIEVQEEATHDPPTAAAQPSAAEQQSFAGQPSA